MRLHNYSACSLRVANRKLDAPTESPYILSDFTDGFVSKKLAGEKEFLKSKACRDNQGEGMRGRNG